MAVSYLSLGKLKQSQQPPAVPKIEVVVFAIILSLFACSSETTSDTAAEIEPVDPAVKVFELLQGDHLGTRVV